MIYNCELCNSPIHETNPQNIKPKVLRKSIIYEGHSYCHTCVEDMYNKRFRMEQYT